MTWTRSATGSGGSCRGCGVRQDRERGRASGDGRLGGSPTGPLRAVAASRPGRGDPRTSIAALVPGRAAPPAPRFQDDEPGLHGRPSSRRAPLGAGASPGCGPGSRACGVLPDTRPGQDRVRRRARGRAGSTSAGSPRPPTTGPRPIVSNRLGRPRRVLVEVSVTLEAGNGLSLTIADDGRGIPPDVKVSGLQNMRDRPSNWAVPAASRRPWARTRPFSGRCRRPRKVRDQGPVERGGWPHDRAVAGLVPW